LDIKRKIVSLFVGFVLGGRGGKMLPINCYFVIDSSLIFVTRLTQGIAGYFFGGDLENVIQKNKSLIDCREEISIRNGF